MKLRIIEEVGKNEKVYSNLVLDVDHQGTKYEIRIKPVFDRDWLILTRLVNGKEDK